MVVGSDDTGARSSNICLSAATVIHPAPLARPLSRGLRDCGCHTLDFIRLGGSILHRWCGSPVRTYGIWSGLYSLSYCYV